MLKTNKDIHMLDSINVPKMLSKKRYMGQCYTDQELI